MSECPRVRDWIQARLDGELPSAEVESLRAHLAACGACRGVAARYERLFAALGEPELPEPAPGFSRRVMRRVAAAQRRRRRWQSWVAAAGIAAAGCLAFFVSGAEIPALAWEDVAEVCSLELWRGMWEAIAGLGTSTVAESGAWLAWMPGGATVALVLLALVGADVVLAYRWRAWARLSGGEEARTMR